MASKVAAESIYDISEINTLKELRDKIASLKVNIRKDEEELEERLRHLPQQAVKAAADNLLPSFLNKMIANGTWKILLSGATMFANPFSKGFGFKKSIVGSAKRLGLIALVKTAYSYWTNKNAAKSKTASTLKTPAVTMLNPKRDAKKN